MSGRCTETFRVTLLACWVAIPPLGLLALSQVQPLYIQRYLFGILPGYALLVGVGVAALPTLLERRKLPTRWPSALAIAVVLGAAFLQLARHPPPYDKSEDLRAAARLLGASSRPSDGLAFHTSWTRIGLSYYLRQQHSPLLANDLAFKESSRSRGDAIASEVSPATLTERMRQRSRIWLVSYDTKWHLSPDPVSTMGVALLRREFTHVRHVEFGGLRLDLYWRVATRK